MSDVPLNSPPTNTVVIDMVSSYYQHFADVSRAEGGPDYPPFSELSPQAITAWYRAAAATILVSAEVAAAVTLTASEMT